jgi:hypothetical protein
MTFSSHPIVKLLLAIAAGIGVGIWRSSWWWGIGSFVGLMFLFIWVASWIFGSPFDKSKVPMTDELTLLLSTLAKIGTAKNRLPLAARGWCNSLGLYVQMKEMGPRARLLAGDDKYHSRIDAWSDDSVDWKVRKYEGESWVRLVAPTSELADWLYDHGGVPEEYVGPLKRAIEAFATTGRLTLPLDIEESGSCVLDQGATSHDAEEPSPEEELGRRAKELHPCLDPTRIDEAVSLVQERGRLANSKLADQVLKWKDLHPRLDPTRIDETLSLVQERGRLANSKLADQVLKWLERLSVDSSYSGFVWLYDLGLIRVAAHLAEYAMEADRVGAQFMLSEGESEETVIQLLEKGWADGFGLGVTPVGFPGAWRHEASLRERAAAYEPYKFRLAINRLRWTIDAWTDSGNFVLNTSGFDEQEQARFEDLVAASFAGQDLSLWGVPATTIYPTGDLMQFIKDMLEKYGEDELLAASE